MKKMLYWQIGVVLLVATVFHLSLGFGQTYEHALFGAAFATVGAVGFAIIAIGSSMLPESSMNPLHVKEAMPNVCGLIAAASAAAIAFFFTGPYIGIAAAGAITLPLAALAVLMAISVVQHVTEQGKHKGWRFIVSILSLAVEVVLVALILRPV